MSKLSYKSLLIIFSFLLIGVIVLAKFVLPKNKVSAAWWNDGWNYRKAINISSHTTAESNVYITVSINIDTTTKTQTDDGDFRFIDNNSQLLNYYIVSGVGTTNITFHVQFSSFPAGSQTIYAYYGNFSAPDGFSVSDFTSPASNYTIGSYSSEEVGGGPIAYWKFDEGSGTTTYDSTSNQNNGVFGTGNSSPTWADESQCISGKCLRFDGKQYVNLGSSIKYGATKTNGAYTIEAWIKVDNIINSSNVLTHHLGGIDYFSVGEGNSTGKFRTMVKDVVNNVNYWPESTNGIESKKWNHVVFILEQGVGYKYYINGKLDKIFNNSNLGFYPTTDTAFIGYGTDSASFFKGYIDDVKIYSYARTADQIKLDYNSRGSSSKKGSGVNMGTNKNNNSLSDGLVGYWKMDEGIGTTTADSSDNNIGTLLGAGWSNGKFGIGTSFDGSSSYINCGTSPSLNLQSSFTLDAWVNQTNSTGYQTIINHGSQGASGEYWLYLSNGKVSLEVGNGTSHDFRENLSTAIGTGWNHIIVTFNNGLVYAFVNGIQTASVSLNISNTLGGTQSLSIGKYPSNYYFNGLIDEVRIYNRTLSPTEVTQLYNYAPGPIVYWDFEENTGSIAKDKSGNNNNGTLGTGNSAPTWSSSKYGSALSFDGQKQYVSGNIPDITTNQPFTIMAWAKSTGANSSMERILADYATTYLNWNVNNTISFMRHNGSYASTTSTNTFTINQWHHVVGVYDGTNITLYVDGIFQNTTNIGSGVRTFGQISAGRDYSDWTDFFHGSIDDVRVYNYARTQKQIIEDMTADTPAASTKSPIIYYKFDEGSGTTVNNSGNGGTALNGKLQNGPIWINEGKQKKGISLDGINDYIEIPNATSLKYTGGDFSFSLWYKPDPTDDGGWIISKPWNGSGGYNYYIQKTNGANPSLIFQLLGASSYSLSFNQTISSTQWNQLTVVLSGSNNSVKLYINGKLTNSGTHSITNWTPTNGDSNLPLAFGTLYPYGGSWPGISSHVVKGLVDELKIYSYSLTDDEVKQDYNQGSAISFGSSTQNIGGTTTSLDYCIPGDTSYCTPPIAEYNFEENTGTLVKDTSGNNNNGTWKGTLGNQWGLGKNGSAGNFISANNNFIDAGTSPTLTPNNITLEAWAKAKSLSSWNGIISNMTSWGTGFSLQMGTSQKISAMISGSYLTTNWTPSIGVWYHIVATHDSSTNLNILYVNGKEENRSTQSVTYEANPKTYIGAFYTSPNLLFDGQIDGVKIYNYARTPAQVAYDYNKGGPVGWWKLDECQGSVAHDSSGMNNTGSINIGSGGSQNSIGTCTTSGTAWGNGASGHINSSLNFDGSDDRTILPNDINLGNKEFTVSVWVNQHSFAPSGSSRPYVSDWNTWSPGSQKGFILRTYDTNSVPSFWLADGTNYYTVYSSKSLVLNNWYHIVGVFKANSIFKIYINGVETGSSSAPSQYIKETATPIYLGYSGINAGYFDGQLDDAHIYNYALTAEQVKQLYNGGAVSFN